MGNLPVTRAFGGAVAIVGQATGHDFQKLDAIMPHPVYGWMAWIGVLSPSPPAFEALKPLIDEGVALAKQKFNKRIR
jgi:hypothetical protein